MTTFSGFLGVVHRGLWYLSIVGPGYTKIEPTTLLDISPQDRCVWLIFTHWNGVKAQFSTWKGGLPDIHPTLGRKSTKYAIFVYIVTHIYIHFVDQGLCLVERLKDALSSSYLSFYCSHGCLESTTLLITWMNKMNSISPRYLSRCSGSWTRNRSHFCPWYFRTMSGIVARLERVVLRGSFESWVRGFKLRAGT